MYKKYTLLLALFVIAFLFISCENKVDVPENLSAPILRVYVDVQYIPVLLTRDSEEEYYQKIVDICRKAHEDENGGDVLVFLPGENEIVVRLQP